MSTKVLPFTQSDIYLGLAEISGLMSITGNTLEIEYKVKDTTLGLLDSSVKSCRIPLKIIDTVEVEKKLFSGKFELAFTRIPDLDNPFQLEDNRLKLSVKKKDLDKARAFRSTLMYEILQKKLDEEDDENENPPRTQTKAETKPRFRKPKSGDGGLRNMLRNE